MSTTRHTKPVTSVLLHEALAPLCADPTATAVLLDIDGTLSPIVDHAAEARVPETTRQQLIAISRIYGTVACVSGRRASEARAMVSIGTISYIGSHGAEILRAGATGAELDPQLARWTERIEAFRRSADTPDLRRRRVRIEDKGPIVAFHWRGAPDETAARRAVDAIAEAAQAAALTVHWGRKVMEVRPPVHFHKGAGIAQLLADGPATRALYAGDDVTDLDAFRALRELCEAGVLEHCVCVGVRSEDGPPEIERSADLVVDGPDGVRDVLSVLAAA